MSKTELDCPHCGAAIIKSYGEEVKFRSKLIRWDRHGMFAVCKSCGEDVPVSVDLLKSIQSSFTYEAEILIHNSNSETLCGKK
jgi:predicted RNA-binding Zn-ribbon protein involved in translation (DUF1610 family)